MASIMDKIDVIGFFLLGISTRTTNQNGQAAKDIGDLWCQFMDNNILPQIKDRVSDEVHCVYTDYETDHTGPYTAVLGCKVNSLDNIPEGLVSLSVAPGTYVKFTAKSWLPNRVAEAGQHPGPGERADRVENEERVPAHPRQSRHRVDDGVGEWQERRDDDRWPGELGP